MQDFKIPKCPSCGSSVIETGSEKSTECSYCGSVLLLKDEKSSKVNNQYSKLNAVLLVLIIVGGVIALYLNQIKDTIEKIKPQIDTPIIGISKNKYAIPKMNTKAMAITPEDVAKSPTSIQPKVSIVHQSKGETIIGGLFWIVTIRNDSDKTIVRPRVIASLFDENNKRIEEQNGWSKLTQLQPGQQTEVLVLISKPPTVEYTSKLQAEAKLPNFMSVNQEMIEVLDFTLKPNDNNPRNVVIVGDVKNSNAYQVDFVRVVAVAKDNKGNAIGLADAYVSNSSLAANDQSGFKIKAGTFVIQAPVTWSLWAFGSKHRDKL